MRERFRASILAHRLRREIVATVLANRIVNRMGLVHPFELAEEEGAGLAQVAAAFVAAERAARDGRDLGTRSTPRAMPEAARLLLFDRAAGALRGHMADLLRARRQHRSASRADRRARASASPSCGDHVDACSAPRRASHADAHARRAVAARARPSGSRAMVAQLFAMDGAIGLARAARDSRDRAASR